MGCTHDCNSCESSCGSNENGNSNPESMIQQLNEASSVKKVIGIVSGKGGV